MPSKSLLGASVLAVFAAACVSEEYAYVPTENATVSLGGSPAARYAIPPGAPTGDVRIASYGIAKLESSDGSSELEALHLRLSIADNGARPWTLDTRDQRVDLDGRGSSAPAFASADHAGTPPPMVTVAPGGKRTVDLFFPLPRDLWNAESLPAFDAIWRVTTDTQVVAERTPFERVALEEPPYDEYAYYDYPGPFWPYGAWYYDPAFVGGWGVVVGGPYWGHPHFRGWGHPYFRRGGVYRGGFRGGFHGGFHGGGFRGGGPHGGGHR
jgi:hypothetical protein